jgi:hypothetical protein
MTRMSPSLVVFVVLALSVCVSAQQRAQSRTHRDSSGSPSNPRRIFFAAYQDRVRATQINQPLWASPLVTTSPRIEQGLRSDFIRQTAPTGATTWNFGNTKGLQIIPLPRLEFRVSPPPFFEHSPSPTLNGFGDIAFRLKYRFYGSNERHHNAIVTAELTASIPTGKNGNGSSCAILTPTIEAGKGFRKVDWQTSFGAALPASDTLKLGRSLTWNNALQYHATKFVWLQDEFNSTFYLGGKYDGKQQTFNTPGIMVSRIPLMRPRAGVTPPLAITLGVGEQFALTRFKTYNHSLIFTFRLRF